MTDIAQAYEKVMSQNRNRQKKFYDANQAKILQKKKDDRSELKELRARFNAAAPAAAPAPCNECAAAATPARPSRGKKGGKAPPAPKPVAEKYDLPSVVARVQQLVDEKKMDKTYINGIKKVFEMTGCDTLTSCLQNFDAIKNKLESGTQKNGKSYALNSIKSFVQCIVKVVTMLDIPISESLKQKYVILMQEYSAKSNQQTEDRQSNPEFAVIPYSEFMAKIKTVFKADSKEYLLASLYNEVTCRDNYGGIQIINSVSEVNKNSKQNYIIVPTNKKQLCTVVIQSYKTEKRYGTINEKVSSGLSTLIRNYMTAHNLTDGNPLFSNQTLSAVLCDMRNKIGIPKGGGVNYIRHSKITEMLDKQVLSDKGKLELALKMRHSPVSQLKYVRQIDWDGYDFKKPISENE